MAEPSADITTGIALAAPRLLSAVPIALIAVEPGFNPRTTMDEQAIEDLASSIALHGLLQPVLLRPDPAVAAGEGYYLTGGHRRFAASQLAGLETVPALLREDGDPLIAAVLDNSHRVDLNPLEEAQAYRRAMQERGLTVQGVSDVLSVAQKRVTERLRILETPEVAQAAFGSGALALRDVAFYAELAAKSALLASVVAQADIDAGGTLQGHELQRVIAATEGLIAPNAIQAGSQAFRLGTDALRDAVTQLGEAARGAWGSVERRWHDQATEQVRVERVHGDDGPRVRLPEAALAEGEAIGVIVGFQHGHQRVRAIVDPAWLQAYLEEAVPKAAAALATAVGRGRVAGRAAGRRDAELTPAELEAREHRRQERDRDERERAAARESNARLGPALLKHLGEVPTTNLDAIRAVCLALLRPYVSAYGGESRSDTSMLAAGGLRYVLDDWKPRTEARGGKVKVGLECDRQTLDERFWAWFNEAKTPEQVLGRTLIVLAALHYADGREALAKERLYRLGEDGTAALPGHPDVARHLENLFDRRAPANRRRRRGRKRQAAPNARPAASGPEAVGAPPAPEGVAAGSIELSAGEREVLLALTAPDRAGW